MRRAALFLLAGCLACARATTPPVTVVDSREPGAYPARTLAVMPGVIEYTPGAAVGSAPHETIPEHSAEVVGEILWGAAARQRGWRLVEPERLATALAARPSGEGPEARAAAAAKTAGADAALVAIVRRFRERVGSDYGAAAGASVSVRLALVAAGDPRVLWRADYDVTQEPLAYNLWNFWGVLRGGPKWLTAAELMRIGIDEAVDRLAGGRGG